MKKRDSETTDLFNPAWPKREKPLHVPHVSSEASKAAAERISPVFHGNRQACFRAIASSEHGITRKQIAASYFEGMQHFVTGPVRLLIDQGLVYEEPARDRHGAIMQSDGKVVARKVDGSAVLLLTPKGRAVAA